MVKTRGALKKEKIDRDDQTGNFAQPKPSTDTDEHETIKRLRRAYPSLKAYQELVCKHGSAAAKEFKALTKHHGTPKLQTFDAAVHFVQDESGSGVNIAGDGLILTCAHCIAANDDDAAHAIVGVKKLIIFADGQVFEAVCTAADVERDVAVLDVKGAEGLALPFAKVADDAPPVGTDLVCVGNPSEYDLEADDPEALIEFAPPVFHSSVGQVSGYCRGDVSVLTDEGLGKLKHGCWTYWGHSGAPIFASANGEVVGLHNSWNARNGQRHGVSLPGLQTFLKKFYKQL